MTADWMKIRLNTRVSNIHSFSMFPCPGSGHLQKSGLFLLVCLEEAVQYSSLQSLAISSRIVENHYAEQSCRLGDTSSTRPIDSSGCITEAACWSCTSCIHQIPAFMSQVQSKFPDLLIQSPPRAAITSILIIVAALSFASRSILIARNQGVPFRVEVLALW